MGTPLSGNLLIGQSGGSTSVINASLAGAIEEAKRHPENKGIYGMHFGIEGFMEEKLIDLGRESSATVEGLKHTPGSALGSSRHKLSDAELPRILELLRKYDIRFFHLIGGNDTMDTIHRVWDFARKNGHEMRGVGIPKTVDNDLFGTDHTPGFASCARSIVLSQMQSAIIARDMARVDPVLVTQTIGRDAGWLAAASALARKNPGDAPHLIYIPERPLDWERFKKDVERIYREQGWVSIVNGEGIVDTQGNPISAGPNAAVRDKFGNIEFGSTGGVSAARELFLAATKHLGVRGEYQQPESQPLCAADRAVENDIQEAFGAGREAVKLAAAGTTGVMVTIVRESNRPYRAGFGTIPLNEVAIHNKKMPDHFIAPSGHDVTEAFLEYARPLVGELPAYTSLSMNMVASR